MIASGFLRAGFIAVALLVSAPASEARAWERCFIDAGKRYNISPLLLRAIARQESSFRPDAIGQNTNGTRDHGVMQINDWWLRVLRPIGIDETALLNPCLNIHVGAWILAQEIARHGMTWKAVGAYHSPTDWRQDAYAAKVQRHLLKELSALREAGVMPPGGAVQAASAQPVKVEPASAAPAAGVEVTAIPDAGRTPGVWESLDEGDQASAPVDTFRPSVAAADAAPEAGS